MASLTNILSGQGKKAPDQQQKYTVQYISSENLQLSKKNFYPIEEIEELADAIELAGGILQPLLVRRLSPGQYEIIAGHRRFAAAKYLAGQGKEQYRLLPCHVRDGDELAAQINLITTNSQREKSAYIKMREVEELEKLLRQLIEGTEEDRERFYKIAGLQEGDKVTARVLRKLVAKKTGLSETNVARLKHIDAGLEPELKEALEEGRIGITAADELARLDQDGQKKAAEQIRRGEKPDTGSGKKKGNTPDAGTEADRDNGDGLLPGQMGIDDLFLPGGQDDPDETAAQKEPSQASAAGGKESNPDRQPEDRSSMEAVENLGQEESQELMEAGKDPDRQLAEDFLSLYRQKKSDRQGWEKMHKRLADFFVARYGQAGSRQGERP